MGAESTVKVIFLGDSSKLKSELDGIDGKVDKSGSVFDGFGKKAALGLGAGGVAAGAAFVHFGQMGNALDAMGKKAGTVFEGSKGDIDSWADANAKSFGLTDDQLTGLAANFGDLLKPMGFTADEAAGMSKDVVGLSGALSAWSGGTVSASEASDILAKAMLGERDGLKGLGIAISEADVQARLAKNGTDKLTGAALEQAKAIATQELIFEKSTDAQKAWADGSMDAIKSQNSIKSSMGELQETLATRLQPAFAAVTTWLVSSGIPALERFAGFVQAEVVPVVQRMGEIIGEVISAVADWWREHWDQIRDTAETIINGIRTVIEGVLGAIEAFWRTWGGTITTLFSGVFDALRQIVEGVLGVMRGIIQTIMGLIHGDFGAVWDGIRLIFINAWAIINGLVDLAIAGLRAIIEAGMRLVAGVFDAAWEGIKSIISAALTAMYNAARGVLFDILGAFGALGTGIANVVSGIATTLAGWVLDVWKFGGQVMDFFRDLPGKIGDFFGGVADIIRAPFTEAFDAIRSAWNNTVGGFGFSMPSWIPGLGGNSFRIPNMHTGGIVPGTGDQLRILEGGEGVFTREQMAALGRGVVGRSGGGVVVNVNFNGPVSRSDAGYITDSVQRALMSTQVRVALAGA